MTICCGRMLVGNILIFDAFSKYAEELYRNVEQNMIITRQEMDLKYYTQMQEVRTRHNETIHNISHYLKVMLQGRQEEFIDWKKRTAAFENPPFLDMLALCREYAQADWSVAGEWTLEEKKWNTLCMQVTYAMGFYHELDYVDIHGREYPVYGFSTPSGQVYGIIPGVDSCAIYSGSRNKEGAWKFVESLLWESNQKYTGTVNPGFPVRSSVLKEKAEKDMTIGYGKEGLTVMESEIAIWGDIIYHGELSNTLMERKIWNVIWEETAPYFAGDKNAEETAHISPVLC